MMHLGLHGVLVIFLAYKVHHQIKISLAEAGVLMDGILLAVGHGMELDKSLV